MLLSEVQVDAVKNAINERRLEIAKSIGQAKDLVRRLETADAHLVVVEKKADFVYAEELDVSEGKAREAVGIVNVALNDLCCVGIDTDDIEPYVVDESGQDVVNKLVALGG